MDLILTRTEYADFGIISALTDANGNQIAVTLEHAYQQDDGSYAPKLPPGQYICQKGQHQLNGMSKPFITFQIMNVPGHSNILFHVGNTNDDSEGCCLLGSELQGTMIINSRITWTAFMNLQGNIGQFNLTVVA